MTIADISTTAILFRLVSNKKFEFNLILQTILDSFSKSKAYLKNMEDIFADFLKDN